MGHPESLRAEVAHGQHSRWNGLLAVEPTPQERYSHAAALLRIIENERTSPRARSSSASFTPGPEEPTGTNQYVRAYP